MKPKILKSPIATVALRQPSQHEAILAIGTLELT
jgi:hypothetical protein